MNKNQLLDLTELIVAWIAKLPMLPIAIFFSVIGLCIGLLLIIKPTLAIEIQRRFYEKINWKIEPISMQKEIRNTRIMGWFLIILLIAILVLTLANKSVFI